MAKYEDILKQVEEASKAQQEADIAASNNLYDQQKKVISDTFTPQIADTEKTYDERVKTANVQKLINERQIKENMANMGLSDSGLNRTQITASQLAYSNNLNDIEVAKRKAVDTLKLALSQKIADVETGKLSAAEGIRSAYAQNNQKNAVDMYNAQFKSSGSSGGGGSSKSSSTAQNTARNNLIKYLNNDDLSADQKQWYYSDYVNTYGSDSAIDELAGMNGIHSMNYLSARDAVHMMTENGSRADVKNAILEFLNNGLITKAEYDDLIKTANADFNARARR